MCLLLKIILSVLGVFAILALFATVQMLIDSIKDRYKSKNFDRYTDNDPYRQVIAEDMETINSLKRSADQRDKDAE